MRIAYVVQNVGISLDKEVGDAVPVKYTLHGLQKAGHTASFIFLSGRDIVGIDDVRNLNNYYHCPQGISGTRPFKLIESMIRRLQRMLGLPYFAFFDSFRFYEACIRFLPKYDLCHEHQGEFSVAAALSSARLNIPYVVTVSSPPFLERNLFQKSYRGLQAWMTAREAQLVYSLADKIICVSTSSKHQLVEDWQVDPEKIVVMPNGVDIELFGQKFESKSIRAKHGLDSDSIIGFIGGFQKWHGIDLLLKSFTQVLSVKPDARLLLIGDGPARPDIEEWIADLHLTSQVTITGYIPQNRVPELLAAIDIAVIPYPRFPKELWFSPLKMYEYMAAGKAIVASKNGQIADVLQDGETGLLFEPGNIAEMTRAIIRLLEDDTLRSQLGINAFNQARIHHSWEQYIARLEGIYSHVVSNPNSMYISQTDLS